MVICNDSFNAPFKLEYDSTPQDPLLDSQRGAGGGSTLHQDHRFQGFPGGSFEKPRGRLATGSRSKPDDLSTNEETKYGLQHSFNPQRPREPDHKLAYGSDEFPSNLQIAKPTRDILCEKSSAEYKKYKEEQYLTEKAIENHRKDMLEKTRSRDEEKKRDLEMLKKYHPWGKPGGGAPKNRDTEPPNPDSHRCYQDDLDEEFGDFYKSFGKPGAGAPLLTKSGTKRTEIKSDEQIHFQNNKNSKNEVDQDFRYKIPGYDKQQYLKELEAQIQSKSLDQNELKLNELRREREVLNNKTIYGKPGGGAQNPMQERKLKRNFSNTSVFDPWGKGVGQPRRDGLGDVERYKFSDSRFGCDALVQQSPRQDSANGVTLTMGQYGGGGAPLTINGEVKSKLPMTIQKTEYGDSAVKETYRDNAQDPEMKVYDPWGKGGAGAPVLDQSGNPKQYVFGKIQSEHDCIVTPRQRVEGGREYLQTLQEEMANAKSRKTAEENYFKQGEVEMASLVKRGMVGNPKRDPTTGLLANQHRGTCDVTKHKHNSRSTNAVMRSEYHTELERAANERHRMKEIDVLNDRREDKSHLETMNNFWGRAGGGNRNNVQKKANLDNILYNQADKDSASYYAKHYERGRANTPPAPHAFIRTTIPSLHSNNYEYSGGKVGGHQFQAPVKAPWATQRVSLL